ncbi:hypothetical protein DH2020_025818 [Rehmannia glutinosa]|uniref:Protein kinase domain-containing protein n=1 Tax=Rehmannia glutinosa TaxID=99300 RepID=A0ABR0W2Z9_REHGL
MAKPRMFTLPFFFFLFFQYSNQLQPSQYEALMRIKQQLNFPQDLTTWTENQDFCNSEPTQILTLACYQDNITQLHLIGNYWFPHLSQDFSVSAFFANIASLPSLKVLSLVSLGLKGPLPSQIGDLTSLEILNITSNSFNGSIPREISFMRNLQTLILDHNGFTGHVPDSLPALSVLSLRNNSFSGSFPKSLSRMVTLRTLVVLSGNNLSGQVPKLHRLTNLQVLDLENNNLGPRFPSLPKKLVSLLLRNNKFHSVVSDDLSSCYQLRKLDISLNELVGIFSPSIISLPSLTYLDISGNKFTGKLLQNMSCNGQLEFVNFSENRLTGELPDCLEIAKTGEALAVGISPQKQDEKRSYGKAVVASGMVGGIGGAIAIFVLAFLFVKREIGKKHQHGNKVPHTRLIVDKVSPVYTLQLLRDARYISETMKLGALGIPPYRTFVLDELKEATSNFSSLNLIGEGSYGQVYKGWLPDGTVVAIRSLKVKRRHSIHTYTHQLELITKLRHCHLVSAIGHCFECYHDDSTVSRIFLVFEFVPNGTLRSFISGKTEDKCFTLPISSTDGQSGQKFTWTQRITAAIGVARGIQFLHTGIVPGVYSNCLKITDILLDRDLHVKISKYNLPLLTENRRSGETEVLSRGSKENFGSMLSSSEEKNDVYDFGVILLELIVGRPIISLNDVNISKDILSVSLTADGVARRSIVDPAVHKECSDDSLKTLIELCIRCLSKQPSERPSVGDVIWNLQFAAQVQDTQSHRDSNSNEESPLHHQL